VANKFLLLLHLTGIIEASAFTCFVTTLLCFALSSLH